MGFSALMKPRIALHWQILAALILATMTGLVLRMMGSGASGGGLDAFIESSLNFCKYVGDLFMRALKMLIVPLIVTSVIAGITNLSPNPEGGEIVRDSYNQPTGLLIDNAMDLVTKHIPAISDEEVEEHWRRGLNAAAKVGLVAVHDAGIGACPDSADMFGG